VAPSGLSIPAWKYVVVDEEASGSGRLRSADVTVSLVAADLSSNSSRMVAASAGNRST
jgi:hypothetical protein